MKLGVLSDTHGNTALMVSAARQLTEDWGVDRIFHLGDDYSDAKELRLLGFNVTAVPGLWCPEYHHPFIPKRIVEDIDGLTLVAVHAEKDLLAQDWDADIVLTGHTHRASVEFTGKTLRVNPGHLKALKSRDTPAGFALVSIEPHELYAALIELDGNKRNELRVKRLRYA